MHKNCTKYIIFYAQHSCKEKNNQLSKGIGQFRARSGQIRSDPVIRPDPVNTRTQIDWMDGWLDGWMDGWMIDGWMMDGWMEVWMDGTIDR